MEREARQFGELYAKGTRNGLTRPKAVRGAGVKMVNMGELFAHPRLRNAPMDRVSLSEEEAGCRSRKRNQEQQVPRCRWMCASIQAEPENREGMASPNGSRQKADRID